MHIEELDDAGFAKWRARIALILDDKIDLGSLKGRICVVQQVDGLVSLFTLAEYTHSDEADEIERLVRLKGYVLAAVPRYQVAAPLLLAVAEWGDGPTALRGTRDHSALAAAFDEIVAWGVRQHASDIHFNVRSQHPDSAVRFTIDGRYVQPACFAAIPSTTASDMLAVAWMRVRGGNGAVFDPNVEQQGRLLAHVDARPIMLRWASLATDAGPSVCLRVLRLDMEIQGCSLASLGYLPSQIDALVQASALEGGAIVIGGMVGSGKSTTLAALLSSISPHRKLITLEDPVEYVIPGALQNTLSRSLIEDDDLVFDAKLRTLKRSALDDLLIGEIRDRQTGRAFMDLVASGTRVYASTHAGSAMLIPARLASDFIGVSADLLASPGILKLLIYQVLLPRLCGQCLLPCKHLSRRLTAQIDDLGIASAQLRVRNTSGCAACRLDHVPELWGYAGRTVAAEWLAPGDDEQMLDCIRRHDAAALSCYLRARKSTDVGDADMTNKTVAACALHKVVMGEVDIHDVLARMVLPTYRQHAVQGSERVPTCL